MALILEEKWDEIINYSYSFPIFSFRFQHIIRLFRAVSLSFSWVFLRWNIFPTIFQGFIFFVQVLSLNIFGLDYPFSFLPYLSLSYPFFKLPYCTSMRPQYWSSVKKMPGRWNPIKKSINSVPSTKNKERGPRVRN